MHFQGNFFQCFQSRNEELLCNLTLWLYSTFGVRSVMCFGRRWYVHCFLDVHCQYIETCLSGHPTHSFKCLQITFFLQGKVFTCRSFLLTIATVRLPVAGGWVGGSPVNTAAGWTFEQAESAGAWKLHYSHHGMTAH